MSSNVRRVNFCNEDYSATWLTVVTQQTFTLQLRVNTTTQLENAGYTVTWNRPGNGDCFDEAALSFSGGIRCRELKKTYIRALRKTSI